jgi:hypothetical protein
LSLFCARQWFCTTPGPTVLYQSGEFDKKNGRVVKAPHPITVKFGLRNAKMKKAIHKLFALCIISCTIVLADAAPTFPQQALILSCWFTAQDVNSLLSTNAGLDSASAWCKAHGIMKVYLEAYGRGSYADRNRLLNAKTRFLNEGLAVASGVTTKGFGKDGFGNGWNGAQCYTNIKTQEELQRIFEYAASLFDEIIIDDWFFTQCQCAECIKAKGKASWAQYYGDLMVKMSRDRIMRPAHAVNPKVKVIIKFPQWYDNFHLRGYEVAREPGIFDGIWCGTESRNFDYDKGDGFEIGYNAFFNMRWLGSLGSVGGGWFDADKTTPDYFLEQARHTILGGGKEIILWCYGRMQNKTNDYGPIRGTPAADMTALTGELSGLAKLAILVGDKPLMGVHLLKPPNSDPFEEEWVCSFLGNLGIPCIPASRIDEQAVSAVFPVHALQDTGFVDALSRMLIKGIPVVITDGLAKRLADRPDILTDKHLTILKVQGSPKKLLRMSRKAIQQYRDPLLAPLGIRFDAPDKVELYLFGGDYIVVQNINDVPVDVTLDFSHRSSVRKALTLPEATGNATLVLNKGSIKMHLSARTLVALEYH